MSSRSFVKDSAGIQAMLTDTVRPAVAEAAQAVADRARGQGVDAEARPIQGSDRCAFEAGCEVVIDTSDRANWHTVGGRHRLRDLDKVEKAREAMRGAIG